MMPSPGSEADSRLTVGLGFRAARWPDTARPGVETRVQRIQRERFEQTGEEPWKAGKCTKPVFAQELAALIDAAIAEHGDYTYTDKGAMEVMDINPIVARLESMNAISIREVLIELFELKGGRLTEPLASTLVHSLDERDDFDTILDHELLGSLY